MNENENLVPEQGAENVEQTTEQTPKMFTQEEVNDIVGKRMARQEARIRKEYERKNAGVDRLVNTLKVGTGKNSVEELDEAFTGFYESKGIKIEKPREYSGKDLEVLARAEANEIINGGYEDVVDEVDRLAEIGTENMTAREKAVFKVLAEHRQNAERGQELARIGVTEDEYNSPDFQSFKAKFAASTPIADVYDIYKKTQPKKEIQTMGSMKSNTAVDNGVKEFYSFEEASRFTKKDFDNNPALMAAVERSMPKWK
jgi:hypothetical protein